VIQINRQWTPIHANETSRGEFKICGKPAARLRIGNFQSIGDPNNSTIHSFASIRVNSRLFSERDPDQPPMDANSRQ
jgi:hypothetical protein